MTEKPELTRILADPKTAHRISRRAFLLGSAVSVIGGGLLLSGCSTKSTSGVAAGAGKNTPGPIEGQLHMYNWSQYDDPNLIKAFTTAAGPTVQIDTYSSNEEMISKLSAAGGTSGYDIIVPSGDYIPQLIANKLVMKFDKNQLPNLAHVDPALMGKSWDPTNDYSIVKDWGTTGFMYDKTVIKSPMNTWSDFIHAMKNEASGHTSLLDSAPEVAAVYFWANGIPWTTEDKAHLDAAEAFCINDVAPNVKSFDSYPGIKLASGGYVLSELWNGDARQGLMASKNPERYQWVLPGPKTELWMDNWSIVAGAKDPVAAHAWINYILDPKNSLTDMEYTGYSTGVKGIKESATAAGLKYLDLIFFSADQLATMESGAINSAEQRLVDMYSKAKAKAA